MATGSWLKLGMRFLQEKCQDKWALRVFVPAMVVLLASPAAAQWPPIIDLSQTSADVTIMGAVAYNYSGYGLTCGDYDDDDLVDIAVASGGQLGSGGFVFFHIFWGDAALPGIIDLAGYSGHVSYVRAKPNETGFFGARLESGDFNGDGIDDIALGIPNKEKVYLIFGTLDFPSTIDLGSPTVGVVTVNGIPFSFGFLGGMLAAGDVNGDSIDDLIMGAPYIDEEGGQVYVLWGQPVMPPTIPLGSAVAGVTRMIDPRYQSPSGVGLACGDLDRDGFDDVVIGSDDEMMLVLGAATLPDTIILTAPPVKRYYGDGMGWRVQLADFNGDNYDDIITSDLYANLGGCQECGAVVVVYGGATLPDSLVVTDPGAPVSWLFGTGVGQCFGCELASGDVNNDGYADLLVTSEPDQYDESDVGKVTIVYGSTAPPDTIFLGTDTAVTRLLAESRRDYFGSGLFSHDFNQDGADDVLVGAPWATAVGRTSAGKVYLLYGQQTATAVVPAPQAPLHMLQNYPNPFNPSTFIPVTMSKSLDVTLRVYDVQGGLIKTLLNRRLAAGEYQFPWGGTDERGQPVASGVYFYQLVGPSFTETRKMMLLR